MAGIAVNGVDGGEASGVRVGGERTSHLLGQSGSTRYETNCIPFHPNNQESRTRDANGNGKKEQKRKQQNE